MASAAATVPSIPTRPPPIHTPSYPFHQTLPPPSPSPSPSTTYSPHTDLNGSTTSAPLTAPTSLYSFPSPTKSVPTTPNAHPYAIKTTSTALLSRSSSSAAQAANASHRYVPPASPAPGSPSTSSSSSQHGDEDNDIDARRPAVGSMGLGRRGKHRYTRSLTEAQPSPMPVPPGVTNNASNNYNGYVRPSAGTPSYRVRERARSFASEDGEEETPKRRPDGTEMGPPGSPLWGATQRHSTYSGSGTNGSFMELSIPGDPKSWSAQQVAGYLTALLRGGGEDEVAGSLARYVDEKGIAGKTFLRLAEGDLDRSDASLTPLARETLLRASRALRQASLRDRMLPSRSSFSSNSPLEMKGNSDNEDDDNHVGAADGVTLRRNTRNSKARTPGRSRNSSLSSSTSSSASASSGRVRDIVEGLERSSSITSSTSGNGGGRRMDTGEMEEDGSISSRSVSPVKRGYFHPSIHGSPTKRNGASSVRHAAEGMSPSKHTSVSGSRALPVRPSVADIFGGQVNGSSESGIRARSGERDVEEKEGDETVGKVVRKNVNGREPRLLPFTPTSLGAMNGGITPLHTGVNLPLPSSPEVYPQIQQQLTGHYTHHQVPHPQHHLQQQYSGPGDYELGFRHAASPHGHALNPQAAAFVVRHGPSPSNITSPPHHANGSASPHPASSGASGRPARLLPYPPVTAETALHHPRPRRAVGVSDRDAGGDADVEDEEGQPTVPERSDRAMSATSGDDMYVSAVETQDESESSDAGKDEEKEKSVAELLADMEAQAQTHEGLQHSMSAPPVTGAQAWEMEMGDTVKRVAGNGGIVTGKKSEKKKREREMEKDSLRRPGVMNLFGDVEKRAQDVSERENGVEKRAEELSRREKEVEEQQRGGEERQRASEQRDRKSDEVMKESKQRGQEVKESQQVAEEKQRVAEEKMKEADVKMDEMRERSNELETQTKLVEDRTKEVDDAREEVESKAKEVDERLKRVDERQAELDIREQALIEREEAVSRREKNVEDEVEKTQERDHELNLREQHTADEAQVLGQREESLEKRLQDVVKREEAAWNKEETLDIREKALEKAEEGVRSVKCELSVREEKLGARVDEVKSGEEKLSVREERLKEREAALQVLEESAAQKAVPINGHAAIVQPPLMTTPGMKQATILDDQACSPGTAILRQCWSTFVLPVVGEKRTPSFLRSPGAATKEESAPTVGDDNAPPKEIVDPTPGSSSFLRRYLVPTWSIRRDAIIGRFMGPDGGITDNYLVLMGIGMCVVVLRVLGRRAAWATRR